MLSAGEGELIDGGAQGGEEPTGAEPIQGAPGTGEVGEGGEVEKWEDLDPNDFQGIDPEVVTSLNKKAVTQYQNKVRAVVESNKPHKQKVDNLTKLVGRMEGTFGKFMNDPDEFLRFHKERRPDYWKDRQPQGEPAADDKAAIAALRKAGILTKEDLAPLLERINKGDAARQAENVVKATDELDAHAKWCGEHKLPWDDDISQTCIDLIKGGGGRFRSLKAAYNRLYKPVIDKANQMNLRQKKGNLTGQPTGGSDNKRTNLTLRQIVEESAEE